MPETRARRSGCAVVFGVLLIAVGSVVLAHNVFTFFGVSSLRFAREGLFWFGTYWPLLIIGWGAYKIISRKRSPVSAAEIVLLVILVGFGLLARGVERGMDELAVHVSLDEAAGVLGPELFGPAHRFTSTESFELGAAAGLDIETRNGRVVVLGLDEPSTNITVDVLKRVYSVSEDDAKRAAEDVQLAFEPGERARLTLNRGDDGRAVRGDLVVRVPRAIGVEIRNRNGAIRVERIDGAVSVRTSNAGVEAYDLGSGIEAVTRHGAIRLERIVGRTEATTRHGTIRVEHIDGALIAKTSHRAVTAENVTGSAKIETRHASVTAFDIGGDVDVSARQSEITVERVSGVVTISGQYGAVFANGLDDALTIRTKNANVMARHVEGDVLIENDYRPVRVMDVSGSVTVDGKNCEVTIENVSGAVGVETSYETVTVSDFRSSLAIESSHAELDVRTSALAGAVTLETTYGDVALELPPAASASLTARARSGDVSSDFDELARGESDDRESTVWRGSLGDGVHPVTITTSYSDVQLKRGVR